MWVTAFGISGPFLAALVGGGGGYRPYFENYTVDASIFKMTLRGDLVLMILKIISQFRVTPSGVDRFFDELMCDQVFKSKR